jgi:hypothetical protein
MELMTGAGDSSSANMANRGGRGGRGRGGFGRGRDGCGGRGRGGFGRGRDGRGRGNGGNTNFQCQRTNNAGRGRGGSNGASSRPTCQVCLKEGHTTDRCWHRYEEDYVLEEKNAGAATRSYNVDKNWYTDTGATDHITSELDKLAFREKYNGGDQVHTASGTGMDIGHIGHSIIHTPIRDLNLKNILHVPSTEKISSLSIVLHQIIMCSLNFILTSFA